MEAVFAVSGYYLAVFMGVPVSGRVATVSGMCFVLAVFFCSTEGLLASPIHRLCNRRSFSRAPLSELLLAKRRTTGKPKSSYCELRDWKED